MTTFKMIEVPSSQWPDINANKTGSEVLAVFKSDRFLVQVRKHGPITRLAINKVKHSIVNGRICWEDGITWDELQEIKNQCGFKDKWLIEYYPPADKVVNVANIRHLYVLDDEPIYSLEKNNY